jgi:hypothetical protein
MGKERCELTKLHMAWFMVFLENTEEEKLEKKRKAEKRERRNAVALHIREHGKRRNGGRKGKEWGE